MPDEPEFFYYAGDQRVPLELVDDTIAVAFSEEIPERRLDELRARTRPVDVLGRSPALLSRNMLVHRTGPAARGPERVRAFAERLNRGPSVRFVNHVFRNPASGLHLIPTDEIIVRFTPEVTQDQIDALNAQHNVEIIEQKAYAPTQYLLRVLAPSPRRIFDVANAYHQSDLVEWAEPNFVTEKRLYANGFRDRQWHLHNTGQTLTGLSAGVTGEDAKIYEAWGITRGSGNVVIAIFDSGVDTIKPGVPGDTGHPGLQINIAPGGRSFEPDEPSNDPTPDFPEIPRCDQAHGTSVAGVAAGSGGKIDGSAPACKILPIKMIQADNNSTADAVHYAAHHAQILNNSWGGGEPSAALTQAFVDVIANGREGKGTIVLFAAGNDNARIGSDEFARTAGIIVVGASTNVGSRAGYSNFGDASNSPPGQKQLSVVAPSAGVDSLQHQGLNVGGNADGSTENIYTTDIRGQGGFNPPKDSFDPNCAPDPTVTDPVNDLDYTGLFSGTSSSCPLTAGICALMLSVNADLTVAQVKYILEATADKIGTGQPRVGVPSGRVNPGQEADYDPRTGYDLNLATGLSGYGFGRVNAEQAVRVARGDALCQFHCDASGNGVYQDAIPVVLRRQNGTNRFVSDAVIELVDARADPEQLNPCDPAEHRTDRIFVRGGPGGFLQATYQPAGGGPTMSDQVDIQGEPP